ncbi:GntR family transcriptional regulator [Streptosporangium nondiastaticum]|uniref:GntR family transcriptional regulator n=1 Tax=Streptosporangium nondiastaticum TaxID=35764 RepID=A0A9X7JLF2_9ACTN|nr:UTRA domain-containing protein [Streptosporangium nondiastaticum]PSJ25895.1 GntR family transcriptional regulator [Streptosporangium nondiastaticum]
MTGQSFQPIRRKSIQRLTEATWAAGRSIWSADSEDRDLMVDRIEVTEQPAPAHVAAALGLVPESAVCVRSRRFVLDGRPVLLSTSYLPAGLVVGSPVLEVDTGPGGVYARLAELGAKPVHFREEIRCRMPSADEAGRLGPASGTPVILICRTAFAEGGRAVEVNEMTLDAASYVLEYEFGSQGPPGRPQ